MKVPAALQWPFDGHDTAEVVLYRARLLVQSRYSGHWLQLPPAAICLDRDEWRARDCPGRTCPPAAQLPVDGHDRDKIVSSPTLPGSNRGVPQVPLVSLTTNAGKAAVCVPKIDFGPYTSPAAAQLPADGHDTDTTGASGPLLRIVEPGQVTAVSQTPVAAVITSALLETDPPAAQ